MFLVLILSALVVSCRGKNATSELAPSADTNAAPIHKEGQGVLLCELTEKSIGLETTTVSERKVKPQFSIDLQIFKEAGANGNAQASGFMPGERVQSVRTEQAVSVLAAGEAMQGTVARMDTVNGQPEAIVSIHDRAKKLKAGSTVRATFVSDSEKEVLTIPSSALLESTEGDFVYVQNGAHYLRTPVKVGEKLDGFVEIQDGVYEGDVVVSQALNTLWLVELRAVKGGKGCCAHETVKKKS